MKKHLPLCLLGALTLLPNANLHARHLTPEEALQRANLSKSTRTVSSLQSAKPLTFGQLYIFSNDENYVILPADDRAPALLGYSDSGSFSTALNPELRYWLDFYNSELESLIATDSQTSAETKATDRPQRADITPLTKTKWNQESPYNELCPKVDGRGTVTGCVATAMAQVLKFFSYPAKGHGEHSYYWEPGNETLSFNYGDTTFEWDKMTDTYDSKSTEESRKAVATLMLACGISVNMHYDVGDSGASTMTMGASLIDYFGYDNGIWMPVRDYYGLYDWENMVYNELAEGRPVLYSGSGTGGGHQFICDGYSGDGFFHFNWGWGGMSNGYYRLTALNPASLGVGGGAGGFNSGQQISLGVKPAVEGSEHHYLMYCTNHFLPMQQTVKPGQELRFKGGFYNYSLSSLPDDSKLGMKIKSVDDAIVRFEVGYGIDGLRPLTGYGEDFIRFPELADGEYIISPAFFDGKKWQDILAPVGAVGSCRALVTDKVAKLSSEEAASVTVTDIIVPEKVYKDRQFPLEFTVVNNSDAEFLGDIYPVMVDPTTGKTVATSVYRPVDVERDSHMRITDYIADFSAAKDEEFKPGEYLLVFHNRAGSPISESIKITVEATPGATEFKITDFWLDDKQPVSDKSKVKFSFDITCEEGYFTDYIHLLIFPGDGGYELASHSSGMIYLPAGETHHEAIVIDLSHLDEGEYMAILYKGGKECSDVIHFRLAADSAGITLLPEGISLENGSDNNSGIDLENVVIYDLNGVRIRTLPLKPGLYIINGKKTLLP